jgi:hypothetical protein
LGGRLPENRGMENIAGRGKFMGSGKNSLVFGEYILEVKMHIWCLNFLNGMELGNNS